MADIPYVPLIDNSTYANKKSSKERKELRLRDLGIESDSEGRLTVSDPEAFISGLGLSDAYAERLMGEGIEFKDFDEFQKFIDTAVESGNTTKEQGFYDDIFSEGGNLRSDAGIQKNSARRSEESDKAADKAFGIKPEPAAPAPQNQAQAARPTLDQPDGVTSADARAAARTMPDFVNRLGGNGRWANQAKLQMMQEAKRRQQNEIAELKKSEKARKRAGEVDEILNAKNDQYRQLYANSSKDRSVEDWDAMDRDQKIKMIQNYNINRSLGAPAGEITGQKMSAQVAPRGSMEDLTAPREFNEVTKSFEVPQEPREFDSRRNTFQTPDEIAASRVPKLEPESFEPQVRPPESPNIDLDSIQEQVDSDAAEAERLRRRQKPEIPADAVHTKHPNVPKDSHTGIYATNPGVQQRAFDLQLENDIKNTIPHENNIADTRSTKVTPPPGVTIKPEPEGDLPGSLTPASPKPVSDPLTSTDRDSRYQLPAYSQQVPPKSTPVVVPNNISIGPKTDAVTKSVAPNSPSLDLETPTAKLPPADPFLEDEPAEKAPISKAPKPKYIPRYGSQGFIGFNEGSANGRFIQAPQGQNQKTMLNNLLRQDNEDDENRKKYTNNNPFGTEFRPASRDYLGPVEKSPTPRTTAMMRVYDAMPKRKQLDVINSFRRHRGEEEIFNPFS
jgi:hypothetical protein